jgi:DNA primase
LIIYIRNIKPDKVGATGTIVSDLSDHFINFTERTNPNTRTKKVDFIEKRQFTKENIARFRLGYVHFSGIWY